jgi:hypothetical protein
MMTRYVCLVVGAVIGVMTAFGAMNWWVDPFGLYASEKIHGWKISKPEQYAHERLFKIQTAISRQPDMLLLGTSRADEGFDPNLAGRLTGSSAFNLGIAAQPVSEVVSIVRRFMPARRVLWAADFFTFDCARSLPDDVDERNFDPWLKWQLLFGVDSGIASARTVLADFFDNPLNVPPRVLAVAWTDGGMRLAGEADVQAHRGQRGLTLVSEEFFLTRLFAPPFHINCSSSDISHPIDDYRALLRIAYLRKIDLKIAINPIHARQVEVIDGAGLWASWEDWKRLLISVNQEEANVAGQAPFQIWDFSGYNLITTEPFPAIGDEKTRMRWYWESSHYKNELGSLVLKRIYGAAGDKSAPEDFGTLITSSNIETHLMAIRDERVRWSKANSDIVVEIRSLGARANMDQGP